MKCTNLEPIMYQPCTNLVFGGWYMTNPYCIRARWIICQLCTNLVPTLYQPQNTRLVHNEPLYSKGSLDYVPTSTLFLLKTFWRELRKGEGHRKSLTGKTKKGWYKSKRVYINKGQNHVPTSKREVGT